MFFEEESHKQMGCKTNFLKNIFGIFEIYKFPIFQDFALKIADIQSFV